MTKSQLPPMKVESFGNRLYAIERKKSKITDREFFTYLFSPIFGEKHLRKTLELLRDNNLLKYKQYGIDVEYELSRTQNQGLLLIKPRVEDEWAYNTELPEYAKLAISTRDNLIKENALFQLFNSLFIDFTVDEPRFRSKLFEDTKTVYNFISWDIRGYGGVGIASFSYTVMEDLSLSRDRVLLYPKPLAHHLKRLDLDKLKKKK